MPENKANSGKMHRVSISLSDRDLKLLASLSDKGYLSANKPTTLATRIVTDFLWDNYSKAKKTIEDMEKDLND